MGLIQNFGFQAGVGWYAFSCTASPGELSKRVLNLTLYFSQFTFSFSHLLYPTYLVSILFVCSLLLWVLLEASYLFSLTFPSLFSRDISIVGLCFCLICISWSFLRSCTQVIFPTSDMFDEASICTLRLMIDIRYELTCGIPSNPSASKESYSIHNLPPTSMLTEFELVSQHRLNPIPTLN